MPNFSEGLRSLCAYTTFGLLAVSGGWIWTAHADLNAQKEAAMAAVQDLFLAVQDVKLELAELNLTELIQAQSDSITLSAPENRINAAPVEKQILDGTRALRAAQAHLAAGRYWLVDEEVRNGFLALGVSLQVPNIDEVTLEKPFGIKMPKEAQTAGALALVSALMTVGASLDTDGKGSRFAAWLKARRGGGP